MIVLDEPLVRRLVGDTPLAGFALARVAVGRAHATVTLVQPGAAAGALAVELSGRDDARPRAYATQCFNVLACAPGPGPLELARAQQLALAALVERLRASERTLPEGARVAPAPPAWAARVAPIHAATVRLLAQLAARAAIVSPSWDALAACVSSDAAALAQARALARGALAFDLALSRRGHTWRAGVTINRRATRALAALVARLGVPPGDARTMLAAAAAPDLEPTVGALCAGALARAKIYAEERRHGQDPLPRATLRRLARALATDVDAATLPARAAVVCADFGPDGTRALKLYLQAPPPAWSARARRVAARFAGAARAAGGHAYFTQRFDPGRAPAAANAVFAARDAGQRARAAAFARAWFGDDAALDALAACAHAAGAALAVTAIGVDIGTGASAGERDVYFTAA